MLNFGFQVSLLQKVGCKVGFKKFFKEAESECALLLSSQHHQYQQEI